MVNSAVFFNNKIIDLRFDKHPHPLLNKLTRWGNRCLTPVRCLFNGKTVTISNQDRFITVKHEEDYSLHFIKPKKQRNFLSVVIAIAFLIPGLMIGSACKGLGCLSQVERERHCLAVKHYTPIDRVFGSERQRHSLQILQKMLAATKKGNLFNQPTKHLIIYTKPGTKINEDLGFLLLNPAKIILVGAKFTPTLNRSNNMNYDWSREWERRCQVRVSDQKRLVERSFLAQWKVTSVEEAKRDIPPKKGIFSFTSYKRIYVVEEE